MTNRSTRLFEHGSTRMHGLDGPVYLLECDLPPGPDPASLRALESALRLVRRDAPAVLAIHVRSDGERDASTHPDGQSRRLADCVRVLTEITAPTIGAVSGDANRAASTLAFHCDLRLGTESVEWRMPATDASVSSATWTRVRRSVVGRASTASIRRDAPLSAAHLRDLGLLNAVVDATEVVPSAVGFGRRLSHESSVALHWAKRAIDATALPEDRRAAPTPHDVTSGTTHGESLERRPEFDTVDIDEHADGTIEITLDRPASLNSLTPRMVGELHAALDLVEQADTRGLRFTSTGRRAFSIGFDLDAIGADDNAVDICRSIQQLTRRLAGLSVPTVACVEGYCLGGGLEIAMATDARVAADESVLGLPEIQLGLIPAGGGTQFASGLVGVGRAKELIFTGQHLDASLADAWGLVDEVTTSSRLDERGADALESLCESGVDSYGRPWRLRGTVRGYTLERTGLHRGIERRSRTD